MISEEKILSVVDVVVDLLVSAIGVLLNRWGNRKMPKTAQAKMSGTDKEKIKATQSLVSACFGTNVVETIKNASNKNRIALMADFAEKLAREYELDIDVDVTVENVQNCGAYNWKDKKAVFNIVLLMMNGDDEHFEYCVRETLGAIVHELRHAVQHKSIEQPGFWNIDSDTRNAWANNMTPGNYIKPAVDVRRYATQPIEKDASTFAALVMKGVH